MKWIAIIIITILNNLNAAEEAKGWKYSPAFKRAYLERAMDLKEDKAYLCEYRYIWKPDGAFGAEFNRRIVASSKSKRDARIKGDFNNFPYMKPYLNKEWWMAFKIIISIEKNNNKADELVKEDSLNALYQSLAVVLKDFPGETVRSNKTKMGALTGWLSMEEPARNLPSGIGPYVDEVPDMYGLYNQIYFPIISTWYTNMGAPYEHSPHVVQSMWFWPEFIEDKDIKAYIEKTQKDFEERNKVQGKKICVCEVKNQAP